MSDAAQLQYNRCISFYWWMGDFLNDPMGPDPSEGGWLINSGYTTGILGWCLTTSEALLAGTYDPDLANREINRYIYGGCKQFGFVNSADMVRDIANFTVSPAFTQLVPGTNGQSSWWNGWYNDKYYEF